MANYVPFIGGTGTGDGTNNVRGGYLLPPEQGEILVNGLLVETGALQLTGDARATRSRKTNFPIWLGQPDADFVGEGAPKPVTGASFGQSTVDIKKLASIVVFTDEMLEDLQNGDLNVLADAGVRQAIAKKVDQHIVGLAAGVASQFNTSLVGNYPGASVTIGADTVAGVNDTLQKAVSAAMGVLEGNGYGDPANMGVLLGFGWQQNLRDSRDAHGRPMYDGGTFAGQSIDPLYNLDRGHSTNLAKAGTAPTAVSAYTAPNATVANTTNIWVGAPVLTSGAVVGYVKSITDGTHVKVGDAAGNDLTGTTVTASSTIMTPQAVVVHKPNLHARIRSDISVRVSNEATLTLPTDGIEGDSASQVSLFQNNLTAVRYEMRLGHFSHDVARAVVTIWG